MSYDNHASRPSVRGLLDRVGYPHLLAVTVLLVAATILLGIATKATGTGLTCDANWPLCDGGLLNLFPANFPSFFEWIHRVVAMVAGVFIVTSAIAAWRGAVTDRRVTAAVTLGTMLTPIQVMLGRETVLGYDTTILQLHFWAAIVIFVLFVGSALVVWADHLSSRHVAVGLALGGLMVPAHVALSPVFIDSYSSVVQTTQYAVTLVIVYAALLGAIVGRRHVETRPISGALAGIPPLTLVVVYLGRELFGLDPLVVGFYVITSAMVFVLLLATAWLFHRSSFRPTTPSADR